MEIEYTRTGEKLKYAYELEGGTDRLSIEAENVRMEKTGVHATIDVFVNDVLLGSDVFNVSRLDPRQRLANRAHSQLNGNGTQFLDKPTMNHIMDSFCLGLWDAYSQDSIAAELNIEGELTTPNYLVYPFLIDNGAGTILYGEPAKGKSWFSMMLAQSINHESPEVWEVASGKRCIFVNLERDEEGIRRRMRAVNRALGLSLDAKPLMINRKGWTLQRTMNSIERSLEHWKADCIILDSISRAGLGLTNDEDANMIMDQLNSLGVSWLGIAHTPKNNTETLFGSQMFMASADVVCQLTTEERYDENKLGLALEITKANDIPKIQLPVWAMEFDNYGISNMREADDGEFLDLAGFVKPIKEKIADHIRLHGPSTAPEIGTAIGKGRTTVSATLSADPEFIRVHKQGNKQFYGLKGVHSEESVDPEFIGEQGNLEEQPWYLK